MAKGKTNGNGHALLSEEERKLLPDAIRGYVAQCGVNPGFDPVPWMPRQEVMSRNGGGLGKYTPSHLHFLTELERDPAHYPNAHLGPDGLPDKFCWACGRPVAADGMSGKRHAGVGKPCPACGFRRRQRTTPNQIATIEKNRMKQQQRAKELTAMGVGRNGIRGRRVPKVSELMTEKAHERADAILAPYFEALDLKPKDGWSPSTTLEFYNGQVGIAEKLLDRVEGKPVNRNRHVDVEDNDVLRDDELSPATLAQLVAAIATGADTEALLGEEAEEGEWEEVNPEEEGS